MHQGTLNPKQYCPHRCEQHVLPVHALVQLQLQPNSFQRVVAGKVNWLWTSL
jgi:hypothetical protein